MELRIVWSPFKKLDSHCSLNEYTSVIYAVSRLQLVSYALKKKIIAFISSSPSRKPALSLRSGLAMFGPRKTGHKAVRPDRPIYVAIMLHNGSWQQFKVVSKQQSAQFIVLLETFFWLKRVSDCTKRLKMTLCLIYVLWEKGLKHISGADPGFLKSVGRTLGQSPNWLEPKVRWCHPRIFF